jgi:hypothetical protein
LLYPTELHVPETNHLNDCWSQESNLDRVLMWDVVPTASQLLVQDRRNIFTRAAITPNQRDATTLEVRVANTTAEFR